VLDEREFSFHPSLSLRSVCSPFCAVFATAPGAPDSCRFRLEIVVRWLGSWFGS
jgi:hypothetical protein